MHPNLEDLLPNIYDYLESSENGKPISIFGLNDLILLVCSRTGLNKKISSAIIKILFHEIRNGMLRGDIIKIKELGNFLIACPYNSTTKSRIFPKFEPHPTLLKKIK